MGNNFFIFVSLASCVLRPASPKKSAAQKIFGSHLFLKNQKIVSTPQTQWAALSAALGKVGKIPLCNILVNFLSEAHTYYIQNS